MLKVLKCWKPYLCTRYYTKQLKEMKYLNVAEKHDAAKTIAGLLSNGAARRREGFSVYNKIFEFDATVKGSKCKMVMTSVSGHLLQLEFLMCYRNWRNVNPQVLFEAPIRKVCNEDFQPVKKTLEREIRSCQGLIIWTDCDREGENIGFEIVDVCRAVKHNIVVYRATFSEITGVAVRRALQNLAPPDKRQSNAVDVRTEMDLRTGAAITRFQTLRLQRLFPEKIADKLISYGSCQIPTLGFVAERYKEVEAFVSEPFWKIKVSHTIDDLTVDFNWARNRLFDKQACEDYLILCLADPKATVESVTVKPKNKWRPTPMDTVEMEKLGSRKLKLSAKETMTIAEKLYTKGIISYPRTETNQFSKEIDLKSLVEQQTSHSIWGSFAQRVKEWGPNPRNGNKTDQAHPPIHPTKLVTDLQGNDARVYELICRHFLACVSKDATGSETVVHINIAGEKFTATGLCIYERNYLDVYIYDKWNAKQIHKYEQGQIFEPTEISMQEGATTAPPLLTEADLIVLMEKHGIGTDATHAEHINTIKERGYIGVVDNGFLVPGVIGMGLYEGYDAMELALAKPHLRAEFEADLKKICLGEKDPKAVLQEQVLKYKEAYQQITEKVSAMDEKIAQRINETPVVNANASEPNSNSDNNPNLIQDLFQCPKCSEAPLALKQKKSQDGYYLGCLNFPDCKNAIWLPDEWEEPTVLAEPCQQCGSSVKLLKFRFHTAYYRYLFSAPAGWYKTCLRCDSQLREIFNINLDSVKNVGAIVSDTQRATGVTRATSSLNTSSNARPGGSTTNVGKDTKNKLQSNSSEAVPKIVKKKTTTKKVDSNIRNYFSTASNQQVSDQSAVLHQQLNSIQLDELFNDDFENIINEAEANIPSTSGGIVASRRTADVAVAFANEDDVSSSWGTANTNPTRTNTHNSAEHPVFRTEPNNNNEFEDSFLAVFRDEPDFEDCAWGTEEHRSRNSGLPNAKRKREQLPLNLTEWDDMENPPNYLSSTPDCQCTGCHMPAKQLTVKKDGVNKGRLFFVCPKSNPCKFFQWADEISSTQVSNNSSTATATYSSASTSTANLTIANTEVVNCKCGAPANSLTVRKDGPNKGRPFYACGNREHSCGFFLWGDADNQVDTTRSRESKKRKCGLCRQEGHTKLKCPRKSEFEC